MNKIKFIKIEINEEYNINNFYFIFYLCARLLKFENNYLYHIYN